jgi:cyclopropane fatty-acyl-phospholipid synthase-like methyltransferase
MGLEATDRLARFAGIESGTNILDAGSGLGGPSRYRFIDRAAIVAERFDGAF